MRELHEGLNLGSKIIIRKKRMNLKIRKKYLKC
jgi:hypothetical protein